jgi:hypothetical protein
LPWRFRASRLLVARRKEAPEPACSSWFSSLSAAEGSGPASQTTVGALICWESTGASMGRHGSLELSLTFELSKSRACDSAGAGALELRWWPGNEMLRPNCSEAVDDGSFSLLLDCAIVPFASATADSFTVPLNVCQRDAPDSLLRLSPDEIGEGCCTSCLMSWIRAFFFRSNAACLSSFCLRWRSFSFSMRRSSSMAHAALKMRRTARLACHIRCQCEPQQSVADHGTRLYDAMPVARDLFALHSWALFSPDGRDWPAPQRH